jgi:xylulokinase
MGMSIKVLHGFFPYTIELSQLLNWMTIVYHRFSRSSILFFVNKPLAQVSFSLYNRIMSLVCGIDLGTQSCKVILYDTAAHKICAQASHAIDLIAENDGTREQKAEWYDQALTACFAALDPGLRSRIEAIGVSGHQHSLVPLDAEAKPLYNIKMWCDTSTEEECKELTQAAGGEPALIAETGLPMRPGYTAPKVLWLKNHRRQAFDHLAHILLSHDYINYLLTGKFTAEYGDASGTALFDVRKRCWSAKVCGLIGEQVFKALPPLIPSNQASGRVSAQAAERFGIPQGAVVSAGGGDNMMSAIGTGTVEDGSLSMSLGTSGTLFGYSDKPVVDPAGELAAFCSSTNGWLPLLCTMNCTVASEQIRSLFGLSLDAFNEEAAKAPIGAEGICILPFFNGERTPNLPQGRAGIQGITTNNFKRANILRAAMEAAIFGMKGGLDSFRKLGYQPKALRLTGGGSKSPLWQSITANIMDLPVQLSATNEAAALGAALQAFWVLEQERKKSANSADILKGIIREHATAEGSTEIRPVQNSVLAYKGAYAVYLKYLGALAPLYK